MAVNGKGENDSTRWNVTASNGTVLEAKQGKDKKVSALKGLTAAEAFGHVRRLRSNGETAHAVRS